MIQCRGHPTSDDAIADRDAPAPCSETDIPGAAADTAAPEKSRVLLLESDPAFREVIRECLCDNGYTVVAVGNSRDGLREVLSRDFAVVLYDPMMSRLSGRLFYEAVNRADRELCERFVFMTGHQGDPGTDAFIKSVNGFVLRKPISLGNLVDAIAYAECRLMFRSVCDGSADDVTPLPDTESASCFRENRATPEEEAAVERILARARTNVPPAEPSGASRESEPQFREGGISAAAVFTAAGLMLLAASGLWVGNLVARNRLEAAGLKRLALDAEWTAISPDLEAALATESKSAEAGRELARLSAHRAMPRWASVLRCIVPPADAMIEILGVDARAGARNLGAREVRVRGIAGGGDPWQMADHFRQSVEDKLKRDAGGRAVSTRFERLDDGPGSLPDQKHAEFVIVVSFGSVEPALAMRKERL